MKGSRFHEKRLSLRRKWRSKIVFENEFGEGLIYLYSRDISLGGLFLEEAPPLRQGAHLFLSFHLPGRKRSIRVTGEVVRFVEHDLKSPRSGRQGAGIRFVDVDPQSFNWLADFVQEVV